jgi:hypothetical protein
MFKLLDRPPIPKPIHLAGWRPAQKTIGQLVSVQPQVQVSAPIRVDLGALPLSLGLFAGGAVMFVVRGQVPEGWPQTLATVAGVGLAIGGVVNLFTKKVEAQAQTPASAPPSAPGGPGQVTSEVVQVPRGSSFEAISGRITSPVDFTTVDLWPWQKSYPVRLQLTNGSVEPVSFTLELTASEDPQPFGSSQESAAVVQVGLAPGETRNVDINMPITSWEAAVDYVDIVLVAKKRRSAGESPELIDQRSFVIE